jgi:threonine/homoserine/homoserine lactone efflux protein
VGIAIGNIVHITYIVSGLALIVSATPAAFNVIKYLGIGYLIYLGITTLITRVATSEGDTFAESRRDLTPFQAVKTGFITNILSPKAPLFFASIFATVVESSAPFWVTVFLWIAMPLNSFMMATLHSVLFSLEKVRHTVAKYQRIVNALLGMALILLALILAFIIPLD